MSLQTLLQNQIGKYTNIIKAQVNQECQTVVRSLNSSSIHVVTWYVKKIGRTNKEFLGNQRKQHSFIQQALIK